MRVVVLRRRVVVVVAVAALGGDGRRRARHVQTVRAASETCGFRFNSNIIQLDPLLSSSTSTYYLS